MLYRYNTIIRVSVLMAFMVILLYYIILYLYVLRVCVRVRDYILFFRACQNVECVRTVRVRARARGTG